MGLTEQVIRRTGVPFKAELGTLLVAPQDAFRVVDTVEAEGRLILGIDTYKHTYELERIVPLMEWIADFTCLIQAPEASARSCEEARHFLRALTAATEATQIWIELVIDE